VLVLSRHASESVMVGEDVVVTVLEVRGDVVRLGISAPRDVQVHREEVWRARQEDGPAVTAPAEGPAESLPSGPPRRRLR
jgi:carbon storage regulator